MIRAVWAKYMPSWTGDPNMWFMDYRNSDGSVAEMCGNGLRVFGHFLLDENLADGPDIQVATRAGQRDVAEMNDELFRAGIGHVQVASQPTHVSLDGVEYEATTVDVGNPHAVVFLPADVDLESLDLSHPPRFDTRVYPAGTNIEFVRVHSDRSLSMRVFERGSGRRCRVAPGSWQRPLLRVPGWVSRDVSGWTCPVVTSRWSSATRWPTSPARRSSSRTAQWCCPMRRHAERLGPACRACHP